MLSFFRQFHLMIRRDQNILPVVVLVPKFSGNDIFGISLYLWLVAHPQVVPIESERPSDHERSGGREDIPDPFIVDVEFRIRKMNRSTHQTNIFSRQFEVYLPFVFSHRPFETAVRIIRNHRRK